MTLIKTSLWTGISTLIKAISTYLMWKTIALYVGPAGLAVAEQFQNFIQISRSLSCSLGQAIVKYVAEYKNDDDKKSRILSSALTFYLIATFFVAMILLCFSLIISNIVFKSAEYANAIRTLGISLILFSLNNFFLSVMNGEMEIKKYVSSNIVNTIILFATTVYLVINFGLKGGLIGFVLNQSIVLIYTLYLVIKCKWFKLSSYFLGIDKESIYKLIQYALMTFTSVLITPITLMIIRNYVANTLSWDDAGYWQGIIKLSSGYLILMNLMLSVYYIPKLSSIHSLKELKREIISSYTYIFPFVIVAALMIFLLKKQMVVILYSKEFYPMLDLFKYQLIGDISRIGGWLLMNVMLAKAMVKILVFTEIVFSISYILLTMIFVNYYGLIGTSIGFTANYILYWLFMLFFTRKCFLKGSFQTVT